MTIEVLRRTVEEITRLMSSICDLRFQSNTLLPISRLPTEILAEIFVHGARDHHEHHHSPTKGVPEWVNISYVCRQWYDVALNCPTLWSHIFVASQRWTEELLARSKQTPLKICMVMHSELEDRSRPFIKKVADHAEHIQELRLHLRIDGCTRLGLSKTMLTRSSFASPGDSGT
jgi:hypothetical protein